MSQTPQTITATQTATQGFQPRPLSRIDNGLALLRKVGIDITTGENSATAITGLLKDLLPFGANEVTAIVRTLNQVQVFNEIVRNQLEHASLGERYIQIAKDFTSIRNDSKRMLAQIEDGKLSLGDRLGNSWMMVTRGSVPKRFNRIRSTYLEIQRAGEDTIRRLRSITEAYAQARLALQEARILADEVLKKARVSWEGKQEALRVAAQHLEDLRANNAEQGEINRAELQRDEAVHAANEGERLYQIAKDLYDNLSVGYEAGDTIMVRVKQTADVQDRVWSQAATFFATSETVLTALSAGFTGMKSLHETTQSLNTMRDGINESLGDLASAGTKVLEAGVRAGYGPTIDAKAVKKVIDEIISFQERSYAIKEEMRTLATQNEKEMRAYTEDGRKRLTQLLTNPPTSGA